MSTFISKEAITRLLKDVKQIFKNPLTENGIYYIHDDTDMLKGYALILGSSDTPYFGGYYFFEFNYPTDYPHSPPKVKFCTNGNNVRFNPNLYVCGKVCVSLLNTWRGDQWTSCQTISTVLLTLCTLLCKSPLLNEPGVTKTHSDINSYNQIIEYANIDIAICDIVNKKPSIFMPFFDNFYPFIKEHFNKNYDQLMNFSIQKNNELKMQTVGFKTSYYSMNIQVDYNKVIEKLKKTKHAMDTM
jgi:ubiquitin-conjugating enzyme E2 Z